MLANVFGIEKRNPGTEFAQLEAFLAVDWVLEFVQEKRFSNATPRHLNVASIAIQKRLSKLRLNRHGGLHNAQLGILSKVVDLEAIRSTGNCTPEC